MGTLLYEDGTEVQDVPQPKFLWTVDEFCDTLRKKAVRVVEKQQAEAARWHRKLNVFESEQAAIQFMVDRANGKIGAANDELLKAKRRLKNLQKKFGRGAGTIEG